MRVIKVLIQHAHDQALQLECLNLISVDVVNRMGVLDASIESIRSFNDARNDYSHSEAQTEAQAEQVVDDYYSQVLDLLRGFSSLQEVRISRYFKGTDNIQQHRFEEFVGYAINTRIALWQLTPEQVTGGLTYLNNTRVLARIGNRIFSLAPFMHFEQTPNGIDTKLCFYKRQEAPQSYSYGVIGAGRSIACLRAFFKAETDELRSLTIKAPVRSGGPPS